MNSTEGSDERRPIGEILVERGYVSEENLNAALEHQREVGGVLLGEILVERGLISRLVLASVLGEQWNAQERRMGDRRLSASLDRVVGHDDGEPASAGDVGAARATSGSTDFAEAAAELREIVAAARETSSSEALGLAVMLDERLRAVVDELGARLEAVGTASHEGNAEELDTKLDGLAARLTGPLGLGGVLQAVETVRGSLDLGPQLEAFAARVESSLASSGDQTLDLEQVVAVGREASAELREIVAAARETTSSEMSTLAAMLDERLRAVVEELGGAVGGLVGTASHEDNAEELETKLDGLAARLTGPLGIGGVLQAVETVRGSLDLGPQLEAFAARVESSLASSGDQTLDLEQVVAVGREASAELREIVAAARETTSSEMSTLAAMLDERLRAVVEELGGRLDALAAASPEDGGDELEAKLDGLAARLTGPLGIGGVLQAVEGVRGALEDRTPDFEQKLSSIEGRLEELRVAALEPQSSAELDERLRGVVEELGSRLDRHAAAAHEADAEDLETKLDEFAARLTGPLGLGGVLQAVEAVRGALDDRTPDLEQKLSSIEARLEELRAAALQPQASAELEERLDGFAARITGPLGVGGVLQAIEHLNGELDDRTPDLEQKLSSIEARLADTTPAERQTAELSAVRETLEALRAESLSATDSQLAPVDFTGVYEAIGQLRSDLADVASREPATIDLSGLHEQFALLRSDLAGRESALATADNTHDAVVDLRASFVALADLVKELKPALDRVTTATPSMDELERLDGLHGWGDERIAAFAAASGGALHTELETLESRVLDPIAGRLDALGDRLSQIERSSADVVVRDEVAGALSRLGQRFDELEHRLSEVSTRPDETVHHLAALRDELAAREARLDAVGGRTQELDMRIAEGLADAAERQERATHEVRQALESLRRTLEPALQQIDTDAADTIEEQQNTIGQLHERLAQVELAAAEPQPTPELTHVAFVPTQAGYALVERESPVPPIGSELGLPSVDGRFRVVRLGPSPLPHDRRRCAYLEPLQH